MYTCIWFYIYSVHFDELFSNNLWRDMRTKNSLSKTPTLECPYAYLRFYKFKYRTTENDKSHLLPSPNEAAKC